MYFCQGPIQIEYEPEQKELAGKVAALKEKLESAKEQSMNTDRFLPLVKKYTEIETLDAEIIRGFIFKIILFKAEKVEGKRQQRIRIFYNCIGAVNIPEKHEKNGIATINDFAEFFRNYKSLFDSLTGLSFFCIFIFLRSQCLFFSCSRLWKSRPQRS